MNWNIKHTYKARKYKTNDFVNINLILLAFELINSFFMESIALSDFILFIEIYLYILLSVHQQTPVITQRIIYYYFHFNSESFRCPCYIISLFSL